MKAQFKFLSGARAGQVESVAKAYIGIGRHPLSDVRFDSERDLDVSARHSSIMRKPEGYVLQDLGSKNGTFVNGQQVTREVVLADGDVIGFGPKGPAVEFRLVAEPGDEIPATKDGGPRVTRPPEVMAAVSAPKVTPRRSSTAVRVALEVARQTQNLRRTTKVLLGVLLLTIAGFAALQWKTGRDLARERTAIRQLADSLSARARHAELALDSLAELRGEFERQRRIADSLRLLAEQGGGAEALERLRLELQRAEGRQRALLDAAGMDYRAIARANRDAIVLVIVEYMDGTVVSGTGFAIDSSGTIVTNKHVLVGEDGTRRPNRLGVKFAGSRQFFRAEFLGTADDFDVGAVRVTIAGGTPRVAGIVAERETVEQGDPVAVLGFPLGLSLPMDRAGGEVIADPSLTVGTVSRVLANLVQVDGYGAPGSSGSPVFDRHGRVIGVLFGGERESQGKVVYVVPSYLLVQYLTGMGLYRR